mgnify:CR=1 FL=1
MIYKTIEELTTVVTGGTPSTSKVEYWENGNIPWLQSGCCQNCDVNQADKFISQSGYDNSSTQVMPVNTVMIALTGATAGKVGYLNVEACGNQSITGIFPCEELNPRFLFYFLISQRRKILVDCVGGAQAHISQGYVKKIKVPVYSKSIQERIVNIMNICSKNIKHYEMILKEYDVLVKARFIEMFGDLRTNNKNWQVVSFNECASIDTNMIRDFDGYEDYPHIGIDSIEKDTGRIFGYRTISEDGVISGKYLFTPKHIIYSKIRPNLNKVALPDFIGLCSADAYPILVKDTVCTREYFGYTLRSRIFLDYILAFSSRTNLPKVNKSQVEGFKLPLPPIELQNQFADFVRHVDKSREEVKKSLEKTQQLYDSLMQEYFG